MIDSAERAASIRKSVGWFELEDRGLLVVRGSDRVRWTDGMLSNDVAGLEPGPARSGCEALLLTAKGRIVSDLYVLCRRDEIWLELPRLARSEVQAHLQRYIIADDVRLDDESDVWRRFGLEGSAATALLEQALGHPLDLAVGSGIEVEWAGKRVGLCAWGWSGEVAYQFFVPNAAANTVCRLIREAGESTPGFLTGDAATLEVLRIEAGRPRLGAELGEDVLPAEAGLVPRAVSLSKGCYTGQEIVARMASRNAAAHLLVGFRFDATKPPAPGSMVSIAGKSLGELTSSCVSAKAGAIGLGFIRRAHAEPGTRVVVDDVAAEISSLPFVSAGS